MFRGVGLVLGVLLFGSAFGGAARAQSVTLAAGSTLSLGSLVFTITGCTITAGVASTSHACGSSDSLILAKDPNYNGVGVGVIIESLSGPTTPILSATGCGSSCPHGRNTALTYDISLNLQVASASGSISLASISQGITGSVSPNSTQNQNAVFVNESARNGSGTTLVSGLTSTLASTPNSASFAPQLCLTASACLYISKDFGLSVGGATNGSSLQLFTISQVFTPAPEPASIATVLVGLTGLGWVRRRRRYAKR